MRSAAVGALLILAFSATEARAQVWTDWLVESPGMVTGEMVFTSAVGVTFTGTHSAVETATDDPATPWSWNFPIYEIGGVRPPTTDQVALSSPSSNTLTFSAPVVDPFIAIMSLGQPGVPVVYTFDAPFTVFSEGLGFWGDGEYLTDAGCGPNGPCATPSMWIEGREYHGMIQFSGTVSELSWTSTAEHWHSITVGAMDVAPAVVPEPASLILLGTGLLGVGLVARRRRESDSD